MAAFLCRLTGVCSFLSNPGSLLQESDSLSFSPLFSLQVPLFCGFGKKAAGWDPDKHTDGICQKAGRGINKRCVGREMKLEVLFWCADPCVGPVWLIKAPLFPFCASAGMCWRNKKKEKKVWMRQFWFKRLRWNSEKDSSQFFYTLYMLALATCQCFKTFCLNLLWPWLCL